MKDDRACECWKEDGEDGLGVSGINCRVVDI